MGFPLWPNPNFGGEKSKIRILSRSIQKIYTLKKAKNQVLLFYRVDNKSKIFRVISWSIYPLHVAEKTDFDIIVFTNLIG